MAAAAKYHIFGRVTPAAKRKLVRALQTLGHCVTMTGDGVNDVLALKEADCSVAMSSGSAAARNVSELVLADNDFRICLMLCLKVGVLSTICNVLLHSF